MPKVEPPTVRGFSRESRWFTAGFGVLGCVTSIMNAVGGSFAPGALAAMGFAAVAVVGYRYPIAYDRSLNEALASYRTMDRGTLILAAVSIVLIAVALALKFAHDL